MILVTTFIFILLELLSLTVVFGLTKYDLLNTDIAPAEVVAQLRGICMQCYYRDKGEEGRFLILGFNGSKQPMVALQHLILTIDIQLPHIRENPVGRYVNKNDTGDPERHRQWFCLQEY